MVTVEENDKITVSYTGKLDNGQVFKTVGPEKPFTVTIGNSDLPPTIETSIIGMTEGDTKKIRVPPEEGYGPRLKELLHEVPLSTFGDRITPKPGMILSQSVEKEGLTHKIPATIIKIKGDMAIVDYNHPLAGHHLTYILTIEKIEKSV